LPKPSPRRRIFPPHQQSQWHDDLQTATTRDKGHGRIEVRTLASTTWLNGYLDWPSLGQVFRLERVRRVQGQASVEVVYGITSLPRHRADAARLLELTRTHWAIENELHYVRDVTLSEDRCRVRCGAAPRVLASVRNVAIAILNEVESPSRAAAIREFCAEPELCLHYFGLQRPNTE
jgi:predicted transposase YbfD/YdcC